MGEKTKAAAATSHPMLQRFIEQDYRRRDNPVSGAEATSILGADLLGLKRDACRIALSGDVYKRQPGNNQLIWRS